MDFNDIIFAAHSGWRWIVVLATIIALGWMILGLVQRRAYDNTARRVMLAFAISVDIQWLLGLVLFILLSAASGNWGVAHRWEHLVIMTLALIAAHVGGRFKTAPDPVRYRNGLIAVLVALVLVFVGITLLPQGWAMTAMG